MTLNELQKLFPSKTPHAVTGHIPMEWVNENEKELREALKGQNLRRVFRGKRKLLGTWYGKVYYESSTRKENATAVVIYKKDKTIEEWEAETEAFKQALS